MKSVQSSSRSGSKGGLSGNNLELALHHPSNEPQGAGNPIKTGVGDSGWPLEWPCTSLFLGTGFALHIQIFLWIGAGACPSTIQVLAQHLGPGVSKKGRGNGPKWFRMAPNGPKQPLYSPKCLSNSPKQSHCIPHAFTDSKQATRFTGRARLWQDIIAEVDASSLAQQVFGTGRNSNAHSTYFFLLLKIGFAGLAFYVVVHVFIIWKMLNRSSQPLMIRFSGLMAAFALLAHILDGHHRSCWLKKGSQFFAAAVVAKHHHQLQAQGDQEYRSSLPLKC